MSVSDFLYNLLRGLRADLAGLRLEAGRRGREAAWTAAEQGRVSAVLAAQRGD